MIYLLTLPVQCRPALTTYWGNIFLTGEKASEPLARVGHDGRVEMYDDADEAKVIVMLKAQYGATDEMLRQVGYGA